MALVPRDLFSDDLFGTGDLFGPLFRAGTLAAPATSGAVLTRGIAVDVTEDSDHFEVKADLPGVDRENISVTVHDDVLRLSVETKSEKTEEDPKKRWHRYERAQSWVGRSVRLPVSADLENIKASYKDGVLSLGIPKKKTAAGPEGRKITVQ